MKNSELIEKLILKTQNHITRVKLLLELPDSKLSERKNSGWNILECCEHLNLYFDYYLPIISEKIKSGKSTETEFTPGILGNYFSKSMLSESSKMKTAPDKNPVNQNLSKQSIENLITNLEAFTSILEKSKQANLGKIKIQTSFSKLIKLKLGDTLQFIVNHNERHLQQAERQI